MHFFLEKIDVHNQITEIEILHLEVDMDMVPSAVIEIGSICKQKASVMQDRVVLGLNSRHMTVSPCPSPVGQARLSGEEAICM